MYDITVIVFISLLFILDIPSFWDGRARKAWRKGKETAAREIRLQKLEDYYYNK